MPQDIVTADKEDIKKVVWESCYMGANEAYAIKKTDILIQTAEQAVLFNLKQESFAVMIVSIAEILLELKNHIKRIEKRIAVFANKNDELSRQIKLIASIPGIGTYAATVLRAEIGNFSVFSKPKQLVAFFGLDPSMKQSGKFLGTKTRLSKRGTPYARAVLNICVHSAVHPRKGRQPANPVLAEYYAMKLVSKPAKVAQCAVMRKMTDIIFAVLRDDKPFELRTPKEHVALMNSKAHDIHIAA